MDVTVILKKISSIKINLHLTCFTSVILAYFFSTFEIKNAIVISMPGDVLCQTRRGAFKTLLNIYDGAL